MLLRNKLVEPIEPQSTRLSGEGVREALRIEEVLSRAHQIHRAHGGLIGYDLEDWLDAERELSEKNRLEHSQTPDLESSHFHPWNECETGNEICFFSGEFRPAFWLNSGKPTCILGRE